MWRRRRSRGTTALAELAASPSWMYEWDLGDGVRTAPIGAELQSVHDTRAAIIEPVARAALAEAGPRAVALDLACSEGWFAHRLLDWGAARVVGVDIRPENIRRAELVRDRLGVDSDRLGFLLADVFDPVVATLGPFDVVLCLGLIYHLENPIGALRIAHRLTGGICVVETQLHEHDEPIAHGWGVSGEPDRAALLDAMAAAGFDPVEVPPVPAGLNAQYVDGHRLVAVGGPGRRPG